MSRFPKTHKKKLLYNTTWNKHKKNYSSGIDQKILLARTRYRTTDLFITNEMLYH